MLMLLVRFSYLWRGKMYRIIRFLAVIALALSPVWGVPSHVAASGLSSPEHYPVWPSFLSTGCTAIQGPGGSTSVSCGGGSFLLSQINSGYACNEVDIAVTSFQQGSFLVIGTADSGSQSNSVTINGPGNYFMQFAGFLTNNLVTIQMTAGSDGSAMTIGGITSSPCPVPSDTPTVNPSFTPTNTPVPVTGTPTPIPTHTPLPSGHSTFTPTLTRTGTVVPPTTTVTPTPGPSDRNCGDATFPLLNCDFNPGTFAFNPTNWANGSNSGVFAVCYQDSGFDEILQNFNTNPNWQSQCNQSVTAHASGDLYVRFQYTQVQNTDSVRFSWGSDVSPTLVHGPCFYGSGNPFCLDDMGPVSNSDTHSFSVDCLCASHQVRSYIYIDNVFVAPSGTTNTPVPYTSTPTGTPVPGTPTNTPIPTQTLVPIPGAQSTAIATSTECPGGCAVAALTSIPGLSTRVTVDTSPFDPIKNLSLSRSACAPFGYMQIPMPVIHGTPAIGSTTPLSYTWTTPITGPWDNSIVNGSIVLTNTALEPCGMTEIPTVTWDLTYWLSVIMLAVGWFLWLIGFVGRLSGEETING